MNRLEALRAAEEHVARLLAPPLKPNGYPVDGWRPPTLAERSDVILRTAEFLWEPDKVDARALTENGEIGS